MASIFSLPDQHDDTNSKIVAGLERISQVLRYLMWERGKEYGLTPIQMQCLIFIKYHDEEFCRGSQMAREFEVTPVTISQAVRTLTDKGLLDKKPSAEDARIQTLFLTSEGKKVTRKIDSWANEVLDHVQQLSPDEKETALAFILKLIESMYERGVVTTARQCTTCRFFRPDGDDSFYCKLLEKKLLLENLRIDCPEHEPDVAG